MLIAASWWAWLSFAGGSLLIDWQLEERDGGVLTIDGREMPLPREESIRVPLRPGKHRLSLTRPGYEPVDLTADVRRGGETPVTIDWRPEPETRRRQEWSELARALPAEIEAAKTLRASTESLAANLREFRVRWLAATTHAGGQTIAQEQCSVIPGPPHGADNGSIRRRSRELPAWTD
jgi:hypothetical protein